MGKMKDLAIQQEEQQQNDNQISEEAIQAAQQEEYYYHCIAEFYGMLKVFGTTKVMTDLAEFKRAVEKKEAPRIILPG